MALNGLGRAEAFYSVVILAGVVAVLTGLAKWKPVQFQLLTNYFGEFDRVRHFNPHSPDDATISSVFSAIQLI